MPNPTIVNTTTPVTRNAYTLTVTPATGWAKATTRCSADGINFVGDDEMFCAPGTGTVSSGQGSGGAPIGQAFQYFSGEIIEISPGATATLTVTY